MADEKHTAFQINRLYEEFFERGLKYFFPFATFRPIGSIPDDNDDVIDGNPQTCVLSLTALGSRYAFQNNVPFTEYGLRMLESVSVVLNARYRMLRDADRNGFDVDRFGGLPEDRYVSAFLDPRPYSDTSRLRLDRIADAIEVLRTSALTTMRTGESQPARCFLEGLPIRVMSFPNLHRTRCNILRHSRAHVVSIGSPTA